MPEIYRHKVPNGPEIVGYYLPGFTATLGILVGTGSADDPPGRSGVSHVLSQAVFQRTLHQSRQELQLALEENGLRKDSALNPEWTRYWVAGLAEDLPRAVPLLADCVLSPVLDDFVVGAARIRAQGRLAKRREQRELYLTDLLRASIFPGHALGVPTLGTAAGIERLRAEEVQAFHGRHYRPDSMILAVAGQFDWPEVLDLAEASLPATADFTPTAPDVRRRPEPVSLAEACVGEPQPLPHQHIGIALPGPAYGDPHFYTWAVITHILGWGFTSRLFRTVRERLGLTYAVSARLIAHSCAGMILVYGTTTPERAGAFTAGVLQSVRTLAEDGLSAEELATAKTQLASGLVMRGESTAARMHTALTSAFFEKKVRGIEETDAAIERVCAGDVQDALSTWRSGLPLSLATVGPVPVEELSGHVQFAA